MRTVPPTATVALTGLLALLWFGPIIWLVVGSLSTNIGISISPLGLPQGVHIENYVNAWVNAKIGTYMFNSLLISATSAILIALIATLAAYALARLRLRGQRFALAMVLLAVGAPVFTYLVALNQLVTDLGLMNTRTVVVLVNCATFLPVPTLLLMAFFRQLSQEISDSARLDGASEWQVFIHVMAPLARPAILLALTFGFVWAWNDVLLPVVFLQSSEKLTLPYGIASLHEDQFRQDYVTTFAASLISTLPMLALYGYLQRRFISGLTEGAAKG